VVGARPQFIKCAVVSRELRQVATEVLVHTGQHYDANMSDVFFRELQIPQPDYCLNVGSANHGEQTGRMLMGIEKVLLAEQPDWMLVYGDTNSTLAGALAAAKLHIPVAHVEAGLRSFNSRMPEEINRVLTDHASSLALAPTATAVANLRREGIPDASIRQVGDVMYDAILYYRRSAEDRSDILRQLSVQATPYVLATIHRAENTEAPARLAVIWEALARLAEQMTVVIPLHPRTRRLWEQRGVPLRVKPSLRVIDPVGYLDMVVLESNARLVITDSGGVQKESFFCRTPCVTLRDETEWQELVDLGWNRVVPPTNLSAVLEAVARALDARQPVTDHVFPYGRGDAAWHIVQALTGMPARAAA